MHPEASDDTQAHTVRPPVPALSAPVARAQGRRQPPAVAQPSAGLALQGHAARACEAPLGVRDHARGTALEHRRFRQRADRPWCHTRAGGEVYGRSLCRIKNLIWMPSF